MDMLKKFFPFSFKVKEKDVTSLIVSIIIYVVVMVISGVVMGLLSLIPVINLLTGIAGLIGDHGHAYSEKRHLCDGAFKK